MRTRFAMVLATFIALCAFGSTDLRAQRFQDLHGTPTTFETGRYGVQPVVAGGYIAVGTTDAPGPGTDRDVYVVRVDGCGAPIWQMQYDITGGGSDDIGNCIVESLLNPGTIAGFNDFAITGYTTDTLDYCTFPPTVLPAPDTSVFFLRIDGLGGVVIAATYGWNNLHEGGEYIRECQFAPGVGTAAGNFIISGFCEDAASRDGYLLRVTGLGFPIWDGIYGGPGYDYFQGCLETQFGPAATWGQIVAVGGTTSFSPGGVMNGFAVRVAGPGAGGVVNAARYGGAVFTRFWNVEELSLIFPGQLVMVGGKNVVGLGGAISLEFYAVRTLANVCMPLVNITHGDSNLYDEEYFTVKEIRGAPPTTFLGPRNGNIVISGYSYSIWAGANDDAILHELATPGLMFAAGGVGYAAYGDAIANQGAWSVNPVIANVIPVGCFFTQGFVLCGYWNPFGTDPGQLYLIKTDPFGGTGVDAAGVPCFWQYWTALQTTPPFNRLCIMPWKGRIMRDCWVRPVPLPLPGLVNLCFYNPKLAMSGEESDEKMEAYVYPNPIASGTALNVQYRIPEATGATITVVDVTGRTVFTTTRESVKGVNEYDLETADLAPGTYVVTVTADGVNASQKFVVNEK